MLEIHICLCLKEFDAAFVLFDDISDPYNTLQNWYLNHKIENTKNIFESFFLSKLSNLCKNHKNGLLEFIKGKFVGKELEVVELLDKEKDI
jgi:oligoendopeptidase F